MTLGIAALAAFSCAAVRWYLDRSSRREESFGGWLHLTALWNERGAFGLPLKGTALTAVSAAVLALVPSLAKRCRIGAGLILGGGLSNLWERARHGRVYDYLRFPRAPKPLRRYVYNLADLAIFTGTAMVLFRSLRRKR